ncbi:hypothetical protein [Caulobacter sp. 17J80-11]|uniref:hypothetical protein n=1 Tax=Caulobacter sp. 17J80-11 TaxID=2763502 RepID=UPI001653B98F|nr:hypothetical protein [Caulobacter sp. 17J80-11]MBC6983607.1 hypothetical protein [Caulobacter sp. 17J80-11]
MTLAVVARFSDLNEAHVACAALRSAGLQAVVLDGAIASVEPLSQRAFGGSRLCVPLTDLPVAREILREAQAAAAAEALPSDIEIRPHHPAWTLASLFTAVLASSPAGWAVDAVRRRPDPIRITGAVLILGCIAVWLLAVVSAQMQPASY